MGQFNLENYVPVHERIEKFYSANPNGRINTSIERIDETGLVVFKAAAFRERDDAEPSATGHAYELAGSSYINKTSYIENCETSAIGRALANLGIEVSRGIASREEMQKVERMQAAEPKSKPAVRPEMPTAREGLVKSVQMICKALNASGDSTTWTKATTNSYIENYFDKGITLETANEAQLKAITDDLQKRLADLKTEGKINVI